MAVDDEVAQRLLGRLVQALLRVGAAPSAGTSLIGMVSLRSPRFSRRKAMASSSPPTKMTLASTSATASRTCWAILLAFSRHVSRGKCLPSKRPL